MRDMAFVPHLAIKGKEGSLSPLFPPPNSLVTVTQGKEDTRNEFHQHLFKATGNAPKKYKKYVKSDFHYSKNSNF